MSELRRASERIARDPSEVRRARRFVAETLAAWGLGDLVPNARLMASETVTNAIEHGGEPIRVEAVLFADRVRIAVIDHGRGRIDPRHRGPAGDATTDGQGSITQMSVQDFSDTRLPVTGRGLEIVRRLAADFGVDLIEGDEQMVWFDLVASVHDAT